MSTIKVTFEREWTDEEYKEKLTKNYNFIEKSVRKIIFEEMLRDTLPLKITLDDIPLEETIYANFN